MEEFQVRINVRKLTDEELTPDVRELVEQAKLATDNSYSPYSHFRVGAALRLQNGTIVTGANQENAAFPSSLCAERTAIFSAQAHYPDQPIMQLAIAARNASGFLSEPISPCGGCRQVILGIEDRYQQPITVFLYGTNGIYQISSARDLLPFSFVDASMK